MDLLSEGNETFSAVFMGTLFLACAEVLGVIMVIYATVVFPNVLKMLSQELIGTVEDAPYLPL
jgi:hypothetical protein